MAKVTKRDMFDMIATVLATVEDADAMVAFVEKEIELLDKRANAPRKATPDQVANEELKDVIVEMLDEADEGRTATEIANALDVPVQKATALLTQLVKANRVTRTEGKGKEKTVFAV